MTVSDELERIWKEEFVAYLKVLSQNLLGVTGKTKKLSQDNQ
jgi:hypothetical protein